MATVLKIRTTDLPTARKQLTDVATAKAAAVGNKAIKAAENSIRKSIRELEDQVWVLG